MTYLVKPIELVDRILTNQSTANKPRGTDNMADIDILAGLADVVFDDDEDGGSSCPDDDLTPLQKLEKYVDSDNIFSRQMVARSLLETVRWAGENNENAHLVLKAMVRLSEDIEPTVRAELMEQLPHIAMYCQENKGLFQDSVSSYLLPIVVRYLNDTNSQVRKTSQAALLVLLEQDLLESVDLEEQVCPVILELASPDSIDDFRTEAVALMSKMAPLVGRDLTIRLFLPRFSALCTDAFFHVRKVCASNFGDVCTVVGQQHTEEELLPKFHFLCEDGVWGVRKACAECFMAVSYACSLEVRQGELAQLFLGLVCDQSRWVRMAAFQALGGFISTFADPGTTGLYFSEEGVLVAGNPEEFHSNRNPTKEEIEKSGELRKNEEAEVTQELLESTMVDSCPLASPESMDIDNSFDDSIESSDLICHSKDRSVEEIRAASYAHDSDNTSSIDQSSNISNSVEQTSDNISVDTSTSAEQTSTGPPKNTVKGDIGDEAFKSSNDSGVDLNSPTSVEPECGDSGQGDKNQLSPALELEEIEITAEDDQSAVRFNDFNYWHTPLPEIDEDLKGGKASMAVIQETDSNDNVKGCDRNLTECVQENKLASGIEELKLESTNVESKEHSDSVESKTSEESNESINEESRTSSQTPAESENTDVKEPSQTCDTTPTEGADDSEDKKNGNAEVPLDMDSQSSNEETSKEETKVAKVEEIQLDSESDNLLFTASVSDADGRVEGVENIGSTHFLGQQINESTMTVIDGVVKDVSGSSLSYSYTDDEEPGDDLLKDTLSKDQDVIPSALLEHYLSMTDPSRAQTVDTDIVKHCAFSLPAVAYTLGRKNWPCLRDLYEALAADMQWKVRRTLAFSIHELAVIVGDQITHKDLVPVFNGFLKDLDEVRIGVLKHLADFLKLLKQEVRDEYLSKIPDFMTTDNNRNWRFRLELSEQLIMLLGLYSAQDISQHLLPVAMQMTEDKVAEVRQAAFRVLSQMLKKFHSSGDFELVSSFNKDICKQLAESKKWNKRQMFAQLCMQILAEGSIPQAQFAKELLPALRSLGWDSVANVRISLAKTLAQNIIPTEFFTSYQNPYHEELLSIVQQLKMDEDRDVRYFISQPPQTDLEDMVPV